MMGFDGPKSHVSFVLSCCSWRLCLLDNMVGISYDEGLIHTN